VRCAYELSEDDVGLACGAESVRLLEFRDMALARAVSRMHGQVPCPNLQCRSVVVCDPERRSRICCECGWPPFCSKCRQPYHYHASCDAVQPLRARWLTWISTDRLEYHDQIDGFEEASKQRRQAVADSISRHRVLEEDENWKAQNCRLCPKCFKAINKTEGCDSMKCGSNYHGGNVQPGCGHSFNWANAPRYQRRVEREQELPALDVPAAKLRSAGVRHFFVSCSLCQRCVRGPRFRCVHCEAFDVCLACEPRLAQEHPHDHVFEVIFDPIERINEDLLVGTMVEVVGLEGAAEVLNAVQARTLRYMPELRSYDLDLPFRGGQAVVSADNVQPVVPETVEAAQEVLEAALAQQEARRFNLALHEGQLVQIHSLEGLSVQLSNSLGEVLRSQPAETTQYEMQLKDPPEWSCVQCTLLNQVASTRCVACSHPRGPQQGGTAWVSAACVAPLIACAGDEKELCQRHFAEQERLVQAAIANLQAVDNSLGLRPGGLAEFGEAAGEELSGALVQVLGYDPWTQTFAVQVLQPWASQMATLASHGGEESIVLKPSASDLRPVFWAEAQPLEAADLVAERHAAALVHREQVEQAHTLLHEVFLGLPLKQWVEVRSEASTEALAGPPRLGSPEALLSRPTMAEPAEGIQETAPPPPQTMRCEVLEYLPITGVYCVRQLPPPGIANGSASCVERRVATECVRPVLWDSDEPAELAVQLVASHSAEVARLAEAASAELAAAETWYGIDEQAWVRVLDSDEHSQLAQVLRFNAWDCSYVLRGRVQEVPCNLVRQVFRDSTTPWEDWKQLEARAASVQEALAATAEANVLAAAANLALCPGQWVTVLGPGEIRKDRWVVRDFVRAQSTYNLLSWEEHVGTKGSRGTVSRDAESIRPVFWQCPEPLSAAKDVIIKDQAERLRLNDAATAANEARFWFLGLLPGSLVYASVDGATESCCKVLHYSPAQKGYKICKVLEEYSGLVNTVPWQRVRPCFLDVDEPLEAARLRKAAHTTELARLKAVEAAHEAANARCFFGLELGQKVQLVGEGIWRRPFPGHSGVGDVKCYHPESRTYDVLLDFLPGESQKAFGSDTHNDRYALKIPAKYITPRFWDTKDPQESMRLIACRHEEVVRYYQLATRAEQRCRLACMNLPSKMAIVARITDKGPLGGEEIVMAVDEYCSWTQSYSVKSSNSCSRMPATQVRPYVWSSDDPDAEADRALAAHTAEEQRLREASELADEVAECVLGFPTGLPVRIVQALSLDGYSPPRPAPPRSRWAWAQNLGNSLASRVRTPLGCAIGDVAVILNVEGDGKYTLALSGEQRTTLPSRLGFSGDLDDTCCVPAAVFQLLAQKNGRIANVHGSSLRPLLIGSHDPRVSAERLRASHESALARCAARAAAFVRMGSTTFLGLPVGTSVSVRDIGVTTIVSYDAGGPSYTVRRPQELPCSVTVEHVQPTLTDAREPSARLAELEALHSAENLRREQAQEANALAAHIHENLPDGHDVELDNVVVRSVLTSIFMRQRGRIVGREYVGGGRGEARMLYVVHLRAASGATAISSDSRVSVPASQVRPVFWEAAKPKEDLQALQVLSQRRDSDMEAVAAAPCRLLQ